MLTSLWHFTSALYKFLAVWIFKLKNHFSQHHIRIRGACRTLVCFKLWIFCWYNTFSVIGVSNSPWKLLISRQLHLAKSEFGIGKKTGVVSLHTSVHLATLLNTSVGVLTNWYLIIADVSKVRQCRIRLVHRFAALLPIGLLVKEKTHFLNGLNRSHKNFSKSVAKTCLNQLWRVWCWVVFTEPSHSIARSKPKCGGRRVQISCSGFGSHCRCFDVCWLCSPHNAFEIKNSLTMSSKQDSKQLQVMLSKWKLFFDEWSVKIQRGHGEVRKWMVAAIPRGKHHFSSDQWS